MASRLARSGGDNRHLLPAVLRPPRRPYGPRLSTDEHASAILERQLGDGPIDRPQTHLGELGSHLRTAAPCAGPDLASSSRPRRRSELPFRVVAAKRKAARPNV